MQDKKSTVEQTKKASSTKVNVTPQVGLSLKTGTQAGFFPGHPGFMHPGFYGYPLPA